MSDEKILIKALLDAKKPEEDLLKLAQELVDEVKGGSKLDQDKAFEILVAAREIRIALNLCWSAYTKRDLPYDLGGNAPPTKPVEALPALNGGEAARIIREGQPPAGRERQVRRIPPRRPS